MESLLPFGAILAGLVLLVLSADRFVEGAAAIARMLGMQPLLIGMLVVGFGTSAPEMLVSAISALQGNSGIALGNAYGSNITNIALILGLTALIKPISVHSGVLRQELPMLLAVTLLTVLLLWDGHLSLHDGLIMLIVFGALMTWSVFQARRGRTDPLGSEVEAELDAHPVPPLRATLELVLGLAVLIGSSRLLVWGAVTVAQDLGVSDALIGLTIVAIGTSLPELASSLIAMRKGEHDIALGNVIGSNLFNTLAVVGIAGLIHPLEMPGGMFQRDIPVMGGLTVFLFFAGYGFKGRKGSINRVEGGLLLGAYVAYNALLLRTVL